MGEAADEGICLMGRNGGLGQFPCVCRIIPDSSMYAFILHTFPKMIFLRFN
jgi:hypothetical protein